MRIPVDIRISVYCGLVLGFSRRLLGRVLEPSGGSREYKDGEFRLCIGRKDAFGAAFPSGDMYWLKGFGGRWQVKRMLRELREFTQGKLPYGWSVVVLEKTAANREMLREMKYWSMIPDREVWNAVEEIVEEIDAWWEVNRGRFM